MADYVHTQRRLVFEETDPEWRALPASARALAKLLVVKADDRGVLVYFRADRETPWQAIARRIEAHPSDAAFLEPALADLLGDTYLVVDPPAEEPVPGAVPPGVPPVVPAVSPPPVPPHLRGQSRLRIRNFATAQGITETPEEKAKRLKAEAEKKARQRAANRAVFEAVPPGVPPVVPAVSPPPVPAPVPGSVPSRAHERAGAHTRAGGRAHSVPFRSVPSESSTPQGDEVVVGPELTEAETNLVDVLVTCPATAPDALNLARQVLSLETTRGRPKDVPLSGVIRVACEQLAIALGGKDPPRDPGRYLLTTCRNLLTPGAYHAALEKRRANLAKTGEQTTSTTPRQYGTY